MARVSAFRNPIRAQPSYLVAMPRYTNTEDGAAKFWEITVDGASFTVKFGKIGTAGQAKTKTLASAGAAEAEAAKLIREKTGKGYVLAGGSADAPPGAEISAPGGEAERTPSEVAPSEEAAPKKAPAKKSGPKKRKGADAGAPAVPPCGALDEKALRRLGQKLAKNPSIDQYKMAKIVHDAHGGQWMDVKPVLWHLITYGLLPAESMPGVLVELDEGPDGASPEVIFDLFVRMGAHLDTLSKNYSCYAPGVPAFVDRLLVNAWYRDNALFESRKPELDPRLQLALESVRRRFEREIDPVDAAKMLDHIASQLANGHMTGNNSFWMSRGGESVEHRLNGEEGLLVAADLFGTREAFTTRVVAHALEAESPAVSSMYETLRGAAAIDDVAEILARCFSWGDCPRCEGELALLEARDDSPEALFAAAESLVPGKTCGQYDSGDPENPASHRVAVRDNLLALGAVRFAAAGRPVPEAFERLYRFKALSDVYFPTITRHLAAYRALPRDRALALCDGLLGQDWSYGPAAVILAAHPDETRRARLLEKDREKAYVGARYWGLHGAELIPLLEAEMPLIPNDRRRSRHEAISWCLANAAKESVAIDPSWASHLRWDMNGPEPLKYWSTSTDGAIRDAALDAFTPETRRATLLRAATEEAHPTRVLTSRHVTAGDEPLVTAIVGEVVRREGSRANRDQLSLAYRALGAVLVDALCTSIGQHGADAAFLDLLRGPLSHVDHQRVLAAVKGGVESIHDLLLRKAAAAPGPKQRVYLLDRDGDDGFTAREGSYSRIGGSVPGLSESDYPVYGEDPMTPILSFDLDEIPELAAKHPGARLLVLFHPDPEGGEDQEDAQLVAVPREKVTGPGDGAKLAVTPVELPLAVFGEGDDSPEVGDLRKQVLQRGGHVGGGPFWIQGDDAGSEGFLFELRDGLCDLNLGDVGSLYAFEGGAFCFQCH
jgi:predicted DNA-binding WGR domain protein